MTLLDDVDSYLKDTNLNALDVEAMASATQSTVKDEHVFLERKRWGITYGTVLARYNANGADYVMVSEYEYNEGSGDDPEVHTWVVWPNRVTTIDWVPA